MDALPNVDELRDRSPDELVAVPKTGLELAQTLKVGVGESVLLCLFPENVTDIRLTSDWIPWGKKGYQAKGILGNWMSQTRLMDLLTPRDARWWHVEKFAEQFGLSLVPVRWRGKIGEIPDEYFEDGKVTGIRFYRHGPWFWPGQKPDLKEEASAIEKVYDVALDQATGELNEDAVRDRIGRIGDRSHLAPEPGLHSGEGEGDTG